MPKRKSQPVIARRSPPCRGVPSGAPVKTRRCRGVPSGAPEDGPQCRGVPSGAPETSATADRPEGPSLHKAGLPIDAYAIRADEYDTASWQLAHHTKDIVSKPAEKTVDFALLDQCTQSLSRYGYNGVRCIADPELKILAARHLADHYRAAGRQPPIALCVLI